MSEVKLVIFDLDGTLLNTIADLGNAVNATLVRRGLPTFKLEQYKKMVGHGMRNLVISALPEQYRQDDYVQGFLEEFLDYYMKNLHNETLPYPGIEDLVHRLNERGVKIAVASNKIQNATEALMKKFFPDIPFCAVCGNGTKFPLKPAAALVEHIMNVAGATKENSYMIGDSHTDIQTARNAGIKAIAVTWGFRPKEDLMDADYVVDNAENILELI